MSNACQRLMSALEHARRRAHDLNQLREDDNLGYEELERLILAAIAVAQHDCEEHVECPSCLAQECHGECR